MAGKSKESAGARLKREFAARYKANPGEALILEHAASLADLAERLVAEIREQPVEVQGSAGQPVANPLHRSLYNCTTRFAALIDALQLPDRPTGKLSSSARAQRAAHARWARRGAA